MIKVLLARICVFIWRDIHVEIDFSVQKTEFIMARLFSQQIQNTQATVLLKCLQANLGSERSWYSVRTSVHLQAPLNRSLKIISLLLKSQCFSSEAIKILLHAK